MAEKISIEDRQVFADAAAHIRENGWYHGHPMASTSKATCTYFAMYEGLAKKEQMHL